MKHEQKLSSSVLQKKEDGSPLGIREWQIKTTMGLHFTFIGCHNLSNVLLESLDSLVDWRKFSLHIINECINFSNHLANYLAILSETESVITLWFVIPLLQDTLEELLPMCPRTCVHSVHSSKICTSEKKEINLNVRQQEDRCEHTRVHALARILYHTEHEWPMATCNNVKHVRIMILGTHCKLWKNTEIMTFIRSFKTF